MLLRGAARSVTGGLVAIALVAAGIVLLQQLVRPPADSPAVVGGSPEPSTSRSPASATPYGGPASPALGSVSSTPFPSPLPTVAPSPTPAPRLPVSVLNNTNRTGLAKRVAARLAARGWPSSGTGNVRGRFAETTVYYDPGQEASAARLRREFPGITRALPRFAGLPGRGLTVVLTRDYRE